MRLRYSALIVMLSTAGIMGSLVASQAQITKTPAGYVFKRKFAQGMKIGFVINMQMNVAGLPKNMMGNMPSDAKITTGFNLTVKEVQGDTAKVSITTDPTMMNGKQQQAGTTNESSMKLTGGNIGVKDDFTNVILPQKPIKEGEKYSLGGSTQGPKCQFVGMKTVNGKQVAVIVMNYNRNENSKAQGDMKMNVVATALVDVTDGWPLSLVVRGGVNGKQKEANFNASFNSNLARKP